MNLVALVSHCVELKLSSGLCLRQSCGPNSLGGVGDRLDSSSLIRLFSGSASRLDITWTWALPRRLDAHRRLGGWLSPPRLSRHEGGPRLTGPDLQRPGADSAWALLDHRLSSEAFGVIPALCRDGRTVGVAIPCYWSIEPASEVGRRRREYDLDLARLARECVSVMESRGKPRAQQMLQAHESGSASIQRRRPSYVIVEHARLRIELHGGFDDDGYRLTRDEKNGKRVLEWYTEGGPDQSLLAR